MKPIQHVTEETIYKLANYVYKSLNDSNGSVVDEFLARNDYQGNTLNIIDITIKRMPVVSARANLIMVIVVVTDTQT